MGNHLEKGTQIWIIFSVQCICACFQLPQSCLTLCDPIDQSPPGFSSMGFSGQEHWSGLPCPPPGDLPDSGTEPRAPALQADTLLLSHGGSTKRRELAFRLFLILHLDYLFLVQYSVSKEWNSSCKTLKGKYCYQRFINSWLVLFLQK